jgi:hypothetical protein
MFLPMAKPYPLSPGRQVILPSEQVVQPNAEHFDLLREPVPGYVGSIQLFACLLTGGEQKNQYGDEFVVGGDVDSFLGAQASVESRSRRSRMSA